MHLNRSVGIHVNLSETESTFLSVHLTHACEVFGILC